MQTRNESVTLGGGCFWCAEAVFRNLPGVLEVTPSYAGGKTADPGYEDVCSGTTGHSEVVRVEYDPGRVSLEHVLEVFFATHDPTSRDRQGNDVGTQYRSVILYSSEEQGKRINEFVNVIRKDYRKPVVTEVKALEKFYPAENYHRRYFEKNPRQPYCRAVIAPKVEKASRRFGLTGADPCLFTSRPRGP